MSAEIRILSNANIKINFKKLSIEREKKMKNNAKIILNTKNIQKNLGNN